MDEITVDAVVDNVGVVTDFINEKLESLNVSMKAQTQIDVAIDELFSNIAFYAYKPEIGKATVKFDFIDNRNAIVIKFIDSGVQYNPLEKNDPDINLSVEDRPIGGLGIFMVKKMLDDVHYEYKEGNNILTITKFID